MAWQFGTVEGVTEFLLVFPDRDDAEEVADRLADEGIGSVRVVAEALAGEDDAEDVDWVVHIVTDANDASAGGAHRTRLAALAEEYDGWLDH